MSYRKFGTCHPFFLEIRRFCCSGTLNLIIIIIHPSIHSSIVFMIISFYSQREANLLQTAADLVITDSVVWTTLRHVVALNRVCLFALWQGIWQQNPQKSMENLWLWFRGGGFLHQTRELRNVCVCVFSVSVCSCLHLQPVMSPSKLPVSDCVARHITGTEKHTALLVPLDDIEQKLH